MFEGAPEIRVDHTGPVFVTHAEQDVVPGDTGVVHQDRHGPLPRQHGRHRLLAGGRIGDVAGVAGVAFAVEFGRPRPRPWSHPWRPRQSSRRRGHADPRQNRRFPRRHVPTALPGSGPRRGNDRPQPVPHHSVDGERVHIQRRLGVLGRGQELLGAFPRKPGQREPQDFIGLGEGLGGLGEPRGQRLSHSDVLGSLARKQQPRLHPAGQSPPAVRGQSRPTTGCGVAPGRQGRSTNASPWRPR